MNASNPVTPVSPQPHGLMSLWDMLSFFAKELVELGEKLNEARLIYHFWDSGERSYETEDKDTIATTLRELRVVCAKLPLPVSYDRLRDAISDLPQTAREFDQLLRTIKVELQGVLLWRIPNERGIYYEHDGIFSPDARVAFPSAAQEARFAGNCFAFGLFTASVFHCMRAAEIGLRVLAGNLNVVFPHGDLNLEQWHTILLQCECKIRKMQELPKSTKKEEDLNFYSQAAAQFMYFKDGWRSRAAHVREVFDEERSRRVINHTCEFFEILAKRLSECPTS
jgi:hypothetical protein